MTLLYSHAALLTLKFEMWNEIPYFGRGRKILYEKALKNRVTL